MIPTVRLSSGASMPVLGLGTWQLQGKNVAEVIRKAYDRDVTLFDTAEMYHNEPEIGKAIRGLPRDQLFLTSKVWYTNLSYDDVIHSCERSLQRLGTDYLDLYLIHWPNRNIPMAETFRALKDLFERRLIRAVGVSNFTVEHLRLALSVSSVPIAVNQVEMHPRLTQGELRAFCEANDIRIMAYSPLAHGALLDDPAVMGIADKHRKSPAQVCIRWALEKGAIVIPKAGSVAHLEQNIDVFGFELDREDLRQLDGMPQQRYIMPGFAEFGTA